MRTARTLPAGPKGWPIVGIGPAFRRDPLGFLTGVCRDYGDVMSLDAIQPMCLVNDAAMAKQVLQDNHLNYTKGFVYDRLRPVLGNGLLTSEGDFWKRQRRLAQPAFHKERIASFAQIMVDHCDRMLDRWAKMPAGQALDLHAEMGNVTLAIVGSALFSAEVSGDAGRVADSVGALLEILHDRLLRIFVHPLPTPQNLRFRRALRSLEAVVARMVAERREGKHPERRDLLSMLMSAEDETGARMTEAQLRDEVLTLLLAGHETTANALTWTFYLLAKNPAAEERLVAEVGQVLEGRSPTDVDAGRLPFTRAVIEEAMRLYPPAWIFSRKAIHDDVIGGYQIPAGMTVTISPFLMHRHPRYWEEPERFAPERFLGDAPASRPRYAYVPFGGGPRLCIGNNFAMMEATLLLARIVQRYGVDLVPGVPVLPEPTITLRPRGGLKVTLRMPARPEKATSAALA